jgi:uncharacterized protein YprB with RNaseH-like and TPR domain
VPPERAPQARTFVRAPTASAVGSQTHSGTGDVKDEFRERLGELDPGSRAGRRASSKRGRASLDDVAGTLRTEGVLTIDRSLSEFASGDALGSLLERLDRTRSALDPADGLDGDVQLLLRHPEGALFLDTETTGLGGAMVFLLGAMRIGADDVRFTQVLARDYREEPALLETWVELLKGAGLIVSFNGKSFDLPVLRDRMVVHGVPIPEEPPHLDLLHHARRRWRGILPNCRLQTLEWRLCGRRRVGDIPGEEIPAAYHRFVRTGDAADMLSVLHHNALDLVTLADIALALASPAEAE